MKKFWEEFKAFALKGNMMDMAIGVIIGGAKLVFKYGAFITSVINFLIMALVLFLIVKGMNKLMDMGKKEEAPAEPEAPAAPTQEELLASILEELKKQNGEKSA